MTRVSKRQYAHPVYEAYCLIMVCLFCAGYWEAFGTMLVLLGIWELIKRI